MEQSSSTSKTVKKAFQLLEILGKIQPARASELARQLKLTRSNAHRLLSTLYEMGYIEKTEDSRFHLSFKLFILGNTIPRKNQLSEVARPYMTHLAELSQENINLAILYEKKALYIDKVESSHYLKLDQPTGRTDPLHCTALGKILLSGMSESEFGVFLKSTPLVACTKNTITDPVRLEEVVQNVRRKGFAADAEEVSEGIHCMGAPIRNHENRVIAALSISGPSIRLTRRRMEELKGPLIETALAISRKMGYEAAKGDKGI
jgi:DNA-binding IclR family transcriptional regulator